MSGTTKGPDEEGEGSPFPPGTEGFFDYVQRKMKGGFSSVLVLYAIGSAREPIHGYNIIQRINSATEGSFSMQAGTVYPILRHLERMGLVEHHAARSYRGPPRKAYVLTPDGEVAVRCFDDLVDDFIQSMTVVRNGAGQRDWTWPGQE